MAESAPAHGLACGLRICTGGPYLPNPTGPRKLQKYLEVLINQEVTANEVKVAQLAVELGLDSLEAVGHDLLHPLLRGRREG